MGERPAGFSFFVPPVQVDLSGFEIEEIEVTLDLFRFYNKSHNIGKNKALKFIVHLTERWRDWNTILTAKVLSFAGSSGGNVLFMKTEHGDREGRPGAVSIIDQMIPRDDTVEYIVGFTKLASEPVSIRVAFA